MLLVCPQLLRLWLRSFLAHATGNRLAAIVHRFETIELNRLRVELWTTPLASRPERWAISKDKALPTPMQSAEVTHLQCVLLAVNLDVFIHELHTYCVETVLVKPIRDESVH